MQTFHLKKLSVLLLVALLLISVMLDHGVVSGNAKVEDPHSHLKMLTKSDLKKLIFDKTKGRAQFTNKETKDDLIELVKEIELTEQGEDEFQRRVAEAMAKRNAAKGPLSRGNTYAKRIQPTGENADKVKEDNGNEKANKDATVKYFPNNHLPHKVVMQYCIGCGYAKHFENIKKDLEASLPNIQDVRISGINYPIPYVRALIGKLCTILFFTSFIIGSFGQYLRSFFPARVHEFLLNKRSLIIVFGIMLNLFGNSLMQNGAFEVHVNDELVYSKLLEGKAPSSQDVYKLILEKTLLKDYS
ncbi:unnamed protein product [Phytomonas sp. Hart1]|nr:unnamed protein product [Phytomonas sp. Hart1]|eukprot:CCW71930.1 unnamed protein product [Phytomonas sp. isolate Hart1]